MAFKALKQDTARCAEVISLTPFSKPVANQFAPTSKIMCTNCLDMAWKQYIPKMISQGARGKGQDREQHTSHHACQLVHHIGRPPKSLLLGYLLCPQTWPHPACHQGLPHNEHPPATIIFFQSMHLMTCSETGASSHVTWYYYSNHEPTSKWHRSISSQIHQITSALWIEAHLTGKCKGTWDHNHTKPTTVMSHYL